jgi:hypothetical protein
MSKGVLINRAAEVYAAFDAAEAKVLREYVTVAHSLLAMEFLKHTWKWSVELKDGETSTYEEKLDYVGEEALHDMASRFRLLYDPKNRMSFSAVERLLRNHVRESPLRAAALDELKVLRQMRKEALKSPWKLALGGEQVSAARVVELHLNSLYLHREDKVDLLDNTSVIVKAEFLSTVQRLAQVFALGRAVVAAVLDEPSLLPGAGAVGIPSSPCTSP